MVRPWVGANAAVTYGEAAEDVSAAFDPEMAAFAELRDKIFGVADDLGIGAEVRSLYYGLATGQRVGGTLSIVGSAAPIVSGSAILSLAGTISSLLSLVGIAVAIVSFFSGDDEEEKAAKRVHATVGHLTKRMSIDDLIHEQDANVQFIDSLGALPSWAHLTFPHKAERRAASVKLAQFLRQLKLSLRPDELALFVSLTNLGRFQGELEGWNHKLTQAQRDGVRQYSDLGFWLEKRVGEETVTAAKLGRDLGASGALLKRAPIAKRNAFPRLVLVAGAGLALSWWLYPTIPLSIYRAGVALVGKVL